MQEINELEEWFKNVELPRPPVLLFPGTEIADVDKFPDVQFTSLRVDPTSKTNVPLLYRLKAFKLLIESNLLYGRWHGWELRLLPGFVVNCLTDRMYIAKSMCMMI
ncbi:DUF6965 family protein [Pedobacter sp. 22226]|uniref:DUF6965 family protein n=1 Tax=Pedobacter sp. 22226 TaxID=3453894 RepID=UPI003F86B4F0